MAYSKGVMLETTDGFEWRINNYFHLSKKRNVIVSPTFSFNGVRWYLAIAPESQSEYVDPSLAKKDGEPITVEHSLTLKTASGERFVERHSADTFEEGFDLHTYSQFLSREELAEKKSELVPSGVLTLVCALKTPKSASQRIYYLVMEWIIWLFKCLFYGMLYIGMEWIVPVFISLFYCVGANAKYSSNKRSLSTKKFLKKSIKCPKCSTALYLQNSEVESVKDDSSLCEEFREMLFNGINHDLIMKVGDKELKAHQDVLRTRCEVFKSMLSHDMKEKNSGVIDIPDCEPHAMEQFLCYIYSGKVDTLDQSNMLELYYIADKYGMERLKGECHDFIKKSLSNSNICDVIQLAMNHSDSSLLEHATEYFKSNTLDIINTVEWQTFIMKNSTVANELIIKTFQKFENASTEH